MAELDVEVEVEALVVELVPVDWGLTLDVTGVATAFDVAFLQSTSLGTVAVEERVRSAH